MSTDLIAVPGLVFSTGFGRGLVYGLTRGILLDVDCFRLDFTGLDMDNFAGLPVLTSDVFSPSSVIVRFVLDATIGNGNLAFLGLVDGPATGGRKDVESFALDSGLESLFSLRLLPDGPAIRDSGGTDRSFETPRVGLPNLIPCHCF